MPLEDEKDLPNIPKIPQNLSDEELDPIFEEMMPKKYLGNINTRSYNNEAKKMMLKVYRSDLPEEEKNRRIFCIAKAALVAGPRSNDTSISTQTERNNKRLRDKVIEKYRDEVFVKTKVISYGNTDVFTEFKRSEQIPGLIGIKNFVPKNKLSPELREKYLTMAREIEKAGLTDTAYICENTKKQYAFYEYIRAYDKLGVALQNGNYEEVVSAYDEMEKTEQKYLPLIQKSIDLFGEELVCDNVDISREGMYPMSFKKHNIACSNINSVFYFVGLCKLMEVSFEDAIDHFDEIVPQKIVDTIRNSPENQKYLLPQTEPIGKRMAALCFTSYKVNTDLKTGRSFEALIKLEPDTDKAAENAIRFSKCDLAESIYGHNLFSVFGKKLWQEREGFKIVDFQAVKNMLVLGSNTDDLTTLNSNLINPVTMENYSVDYEGALKNITLDENFIRQSMQNVLDFRKERRQFINEDPSFDRLSADIDENDVLHASREIVADLVRTKGYDKSNTELDKMIKTFLYYPEKLLNDYIKETNSNQKMKYKFTDERTEDLNKEVSDNHIIGVNQVVDNNRNLLMRNPFSAEMFKDAIEALDFYEKNNLNDTVRVFKQNLKNVKIKGIPFSITDKLISNCLKNPEKTETLIGLYQNDLKSKNTPETSAVIEEMKKDFNPALGITEANPGGSDYSVSDYSKAMLNLLGNHVAKNPDNPEQQMLKSRSQVIAEAREFENKVRGIVLGGGCPEFAHSAMLNENGRFNENKTTSLQNCLTDDQIYTAYTNKLNVAAINAAAENVSQTIPDLDKSKNPEQSVNLFKEKMEIAKSLVEIRSGRTGWWKFTHPFVNSAEKKALANMKQAFINKGMTSESYDQYMNASGAQEKNVMDNLCQQINEKYQQNMPPEVDLNASFKLEDELSREIFEEQMKGDVADELEADQNVVKNEIDELQN